MTLYCNRTQSLTLGLALIILLSMNTVYAAEPCPWKDTNQASACVQWNIMAARLEAAEARAAAAEQALKAMEGALQSMEQSLHSMANTATPPAPTHSPKLDITTAGAAAESSSTATPPTPPQANPDGERRAKATIQRFMRFLDQQTIGIEVGGFVLDIGIEVGGFVLDQNYQLQEQNGTYNALFNEAAFAIDDIRIDFGPLRLALQPLDDDRTKLNVRFGDAIVGREDDDVFMRLSIGEQNIHGTWMDRIQNFLDLQVEFADLKLSVDEEEGAARLNTVNIDHTMNVNDDDSWQQQQTWKLSDLMISGDKGQQLKLARLSGDLDFSGQKLTRLLSLTEDFQRYTDHLDDLDEPPLEFFGKLGEMLGLFDSYGMTISGSGLEVSNRGQLMGQIDHIGLSNSFASKTEGSRLGYRLELDGLSTPMAPITADTRTPTSPYRGRFG